MKRLLIVSFCILFLCCSNEKKFPVAGFDKSELFQQFLKKFKPVNLPYIFRFTDKEADNIEKLEVLNSKSSDTLFVVSENLDGVYCYGYLSDTSKFYSLIFMFPADSYYPYLITYSKEGNLISQNNLLANGCGLDCGLNRFSENAIVNKDYSIYCADTVVWDYFCDSVGPIPNSGMTWIDYKKGKVSRTGKITMSKTQRLEIKNNP